MAMESWNKKLWSAALDGNNKSVEECLENGGEVNCKDGWGRTALHLAAMNGHKDTVDLLMSHGGDIDSKDWEGQTPYDYTQNKVIKKFLKAARDKFILGLPVELYELDKESASVFTDLLKKDSYELFELRSMLLGEQGTGKSTIARFLSGKKPTLHRISTDGIDLFTGVSFFDDETEEWICVKQGFAMEDIIVSRSIKSFKQEGQSSQKLPAEMKTEMAERIKTENMPPDEIHEEKCENEPSSPLKTMKTTLKRLKAFAGIKGTVPEKNNSLTKEEFFDKSIEVAIKEFHKRKLVPVTIWDFGGQDVFYSTHQTFLTYRAVYILVLDGSRTLDEPCKYNQFLSGRDGEKTQKDYVTFWINTIITYCKGEIEGFPKIIVILTHKDKLEVGEIEKRRDKMFGTIEEMFNNSPFKQHLEIEDKIFVNARNSNDPEMEKIKKTLIKQARIQPTWGQKLPKCFLPLELKIVDLVKNGGTILRIEDLKTINAQQPIRPLEDSELKLFLKFQHSVGKIIYFDEPHLNQHIIISPVYLIDAFKSIITDEQFCKGEKERTKSWDSMGTRGIISKQAIETIWQKKYAHCYKSRSYLLEVMTRLDILAELRRYDSNHCRLPTQFYYVASMVRKQDTTEYLQSNTFSERNIAISFDSSAPIIPPALSFRFISYCLSIWGVKSHGDNEDMLFHRSAVFTIDHDHDLHIKCEDKRLIVRLVHAKSCALIMRDLASSIQECLLAALNRICQLYIKINSESTGNIRSFNVKLCCGSPTEPCTITEKEIGDVWKCSRHQIERSRGLVLSWFTEKGNESCDDSCPVTDSKFLKETPNDLHLKRLAQEYDMIEVRELVIELGLPYKELETLYTGTLNDKFKELKKCFMMKCFTFHDLKIAAEKKQIQNLHIICKVLRDRFIEVDGENEKWDFTATDEDIDKLAYVVGSKSLPFLVELGLTFQDWEEIEHSQKQVNDLEKLNRAIMDAWKKNCQKHKIKHSLRTIARAFENIGINIKIIERTLFN